MSDERPSRIEFTDEEAAFLRHVRFGELPARIRPTDFVELTESDARQAVPEPAGDLRDWDVR